MQPRRCFAPVAIMLASALCAVPIASAVAQAPAASDTIVQLAVNPASRTDTPFVTLLDELQFRLEPDGRNTRRRRQVIQLLTDAAARAKSEQSFSFSPSHQTFTLHWVRVLRPDGTVVSDHPAQEQDADVPAAMNNPVYQEQKIRRLSLAGLTAGAILDLSWTVEEKAPYRAGDFYDLRFVNSPVEIIRFRYALDVPESFTPRIREHNVRVRPTEVVQSGRRVTLWTASNLPRVRAEPFLADSNDVVQSITVSPPGSWNDIAQWYQTLASDRYTLTPAVAHTIDSIVGAAPAKSQTDTIRALHRWVAQDIRYLSVALGIGGYQPRTPEQVLSTGFGDCKDKATLFVAALRKYGIEANPVLLSSNGSTDRNTPSIFQFDHAIAAVRNGDQWVFTDLTAEAIPYGVLPPSYQGGMGLIVLRDGRGEQVTLPAAPPDSNTSTIRVLGTLLADGSVTVRVTDQATGTSALRTRQAFYAPMEAAQRAGALRALGAAYFKDGTADSLITFNGRDLNADARISFRAQAANALRTVGTIKLFTMPTALRGPAQNYGTLATSLQAAPPRKFTIDVSRLLGATTSVTEFELTLPAGWTAELPKDVTSTSIAGKYQTHYSLQDRVLRITRTVQGARGVYAPQRIGEIIAWLKTVAADDVEFIQLTPPS